MLDEIMLWWTDRQHRARGLGDDLFGGGSEQGARQAAPAMRDYRDQIDIVVADCFGDFGSRLAFDYDRLDLNSIEQRIGKELLDFAAKLQKPFILLLMKHTLRQGHQIRRYLGALNTKEHDPAPALARKRRRIL